MVKSLAKYIDDEGLHIVIFNEDGSMFEHLLKPQDQITNEDLARLNY